METAAVARGGRVLINESTATAFKNRIAGWPQIELLGALRVIVCKAPHPQMYPQTLSSRKHRKRHHRPPAKYP